jgi:hypothetical protein
MAGFQSSYQVKAVVPNKNTNKLLAAMNTGFGVHWTQKIGGKQKDKGTMIKEDAKKYDSIQWRMKGAYVH